MWGAGTADCSHWLTACVVTALVVQEAPVGAKRRKPSHVKQVRHAALLCWVKFLQKQLCRAAVYMHHARAPCLCIGVLRASMWHAVPKPRMAHRPISKYAVLLLLPLLPTCRRNALRHVTVVLCAGSSGWHEQHACCDCQARTLQGCALPVAGQLHQAQHLQQQLGNSRSCCSSRYHTAACLIILVWR
jgi:hypothetical protein